MKSLFAMALMLCAGLSWGASPPAVSAVQSITGEVLEVRDVENYTYMRLKTSTGEVWTAVGTAAVKNGAKVTVENAEQMDNFESKTLKKKFPIIFFGSLAQTKLSAAEVAAQVASAHAAAPKADAVADTKVTKAAGSDAFTVAELVTKVATLKDKPVVLRAKVVKFSPAIMGKNWAHLRDGSGSAADGSNDVVLTTQELVKVGDVVTFKGNLRKDKDFGAGYTYKVIVEDAKLQK